MSILELPDELLYYILRRLDGRDVLRCRAVCRRLRDVVDSLPDCSWRRICYNDRRWYDHPSYYENVHSKHGLSWRETFTAVNSWANIHSAGVRILELCDDVQRVKVLPNGVLACLTTSGRCKNEGLCNMIIYYNTKTLKECGRVKFGFSFASHQYDENEYFRVLVYCDHTRSLTGVLRIMIKENNEQFNVGTLMRRSTFNVIFSTYTLIGREVYFQNKDDLVHVSKLKEEDGRLSIETKKICNKEISTNILKFSCMDGKVFALSDSVDIYMNTFEDWKLLRNSASGWHNFHYLKCRGFDWRYENLFFDKPCYKFTERNVSLKVSAESGNLMLDIFHLPNCIYGSAKLLDILTSSKPIKSIDLESIVNLESVSMMEQIGIVEIENKHQIVILYGTKVFLVEISPCHQTTQMTLRSSRKPIYVKSQRNKKYRKRIGQYKGN